ncbi:hypothetical protein EDC39_102151 [Geothermobacter ehrlichii]|uniref:Uncharacterized protein n=1 Tax=Geothermobacter ehrlichii TaxID=213224 RepID=A0A5D3WNG2_9BACT|nr:hypothetical protein [Geothermobacter ehrlichii]TYO99628.1 hypothetical protein EDC39_102151 [Geothermobacter ehrlichii]
MRTMRTIFLAFLAAALLVACSLPPDKPVTRQELMATRIYNYYIIEESPEMILNALNRDGEVVIATKRNIPGKNYPVHLKLLATAEGIEVVDYDR